VPLVLDGGGGGEDLVGRTVVALGGHGLVVLNRLRGHLLLLIASSADPLPGSSDVRTIAVLGRQVPPHLHVRLLLELAVVGDVAVGSRRKRKQD
jgi:hypothetical protein